MDHNCFNYLLHVKVDGNKIYFWFLRKITVEKVSVCIPVASSEKIEFLSRTIQDVFSKTKYLGEVIIVSSNPPAIVKPKNFPSNIVYTFVYLPEEVGPGIARNICLEYARYPYVIYMDAHVELPIDYDEELINVFKEDKSIAIVTYPIHVYGHPEGVKGWCMVMDEDLSVNWVVTKPGKEKVIEVPAICGCFYAVNKNVIKEYSIIGHLPGYGHEDLELPMRMWLLGFKTVVVDNGKSVGHHFKSFESGDIPQWHEKRWFYHALNMILIPYLNYTGERYDKAINMLKEKYQWVFNQVWNKVVTEYSWVRQELLKRRIRSDNDYFQWVREFKEKYL